MIDLDWDGKSILVAKGGKGGKGNGSNVGIREPILGDEGQVFYIHSSKRKV